MAWQVIRAGLVLGAVLYRLGQLHGHWSSFLERLPRAWHHRPNASSELWLIKECLTTEGTGVQLGGLYLTASKASQIVIIQSVSLFVTLALRALKSQVASIGPSAEPLGA